MKYIVDVDGERFEVELEGDRVRVNGGAAGRAELAGVPGTPIHLLTLGDAVHTVAARRESAKGSWMLRLHGRRFAVDALDDRTRAIRDLAAANAKPSGPRPLVAPMPGLVVRVAVAVGDQVAAGQGLVAMEAMKMENELRAPAAGTVRAIRVAAGQAVEKGAVLVEFE